MQTRILVGVIYVILVTIPMFLGGLWSLTLFLLMGAVGGYEFFRMAAKGGYHPTTWLGIGWLLALIFAVTRPEVLPLLTVLTVGLFLTFVLALFQEENPLSMTLATATGAIYLGIMIGQMAALRMLPNGMWWIFFGLFVTWANDTMAYFVGVTVGRKKIWPRLSPKKTWEGTVGGWLGAAAVGGAVAWFAPLPISVFHGMAVGLGAGVLAFFGDLSMSMVKRRVGVKDSGTIFPGHGGMLDRIDSILFVLPFVFQAVLFFGPI